MKNHRICGENLCDPSTPSRATCTKCAKTTFCLTPPRVHAQHNVQYWGSRALPPHCVAESGARIGFGRRTTYLATFLAALLATYLDTYLDTYPATYLATYSPSYMHALRPIYLHTWLPTYLATCLHT